MLDDFVDLLGRKQLSVAALMPWLTTTPSTRASSRWFASTSSPTRNNNATAVSRSPSRIASASARSTTRGSPPGPGSLYRGERLQLFLSRPLSRRLRNVSRTGSRGLPGGGFMREEVADFLHYCRIERRLAEMTCKAYERDVRACLAFLSERGIRDLGLVRPPDLRAFLAAEAERRPALGSQTRAVAALKVFFRFCVE